MIPEIKLMIPGEFPGIFRSPFEIKKKGCRYRTPFIAHYLPFGFVFVAPAAFLPAAGAAFLLLAFVAIFVRYNQPQP
jgi:hypothetical protein